MRRVAPEMTKAVRDAYTRVGTGMEALGHIHEALDGVEWSPDTLDEIATILNGIGYTIRPPEEYPESWSFQANIMVEMNDEGTEVARVVVLPHNGADFSQDEGHVDRSQHEVNTMLGQHLDDVRFTRDGGNDRYLIEWEG